MSSNYIIQTIITLNELYTKYAIEIPDYQRDQCKERIEEMVKFQEEHWRKYGCLFIVGSLVIEDRDGKLFLLDGQHRYETFKRVMYRRPDATIALTVINNSDSGYNQSSMDLFKLVNQAVPVSSRFLDEEVKKFSLMVDSVYDLYLSENPTKTSVLLKLDDICDRLKKSEFFDDFKDGNDMFEYLKFVNRLVYGRLKSEECIGGFNIVGHEKTLTRSRKTGFMRQHLYLGFNKKKHYHLLFEQEMFDDYRSNK